VISQYVYSQAAPLAEKKTKGAAKKGGKPAKKGVAADGSAPLGRFLSYKEVRFYFISWM
jgi:hypothetical protein